MSQPIDLNRNAVLFPPFLDSLTLDAPSATISPRLVKSDTFSQRTDDR